MKVRPEFPFPLKRSVCRISLSVFPCCTCTENTVEKMRIPHMRLTTLLQSGVIVPSFTAPWERFMKEA